MTRTLDGLELAPADAIVTGNERHDDGDHYTVNRSGMTVELTLPNDPRSDGTERLASAAPGELGQTHDQVCRVRGGYTDLVLRYLGGESLGALANEHTGGDREAAYRLLRKGLANLQQRLQRDR